jgi:small-conductance mechanosensitive channel
MVLTVMMGVIACVAAGFGLVGIVEFRWYTAEQRNQAPVLMALKVGLAVLISAVGLVSLAGLALGLSASVFDAGAILALSSLLYVVVDRWLLSKLDLEYGPLEQRWLSWWEYPVDQ